ncbi:endonuclease/exonuclease/phosphatase family protein [Streptomyces albus subsp. chlorinus]|uniref:endonuclease/exonuclease/phosphatase family protein n=1 Tax=Streptomyces albus TaxID=1888 RepID=UPI00156EB714|nr:endonuclease/exonuclease/phosphatase family protein [Streptomyces albus]NSC20512.1 endonuclease/exonuclease/phosphatase family protein [Streptomyces albus subsp. chlorinus]
MTSAAPRLTRRGGIRTAAAAALALPLAAGAARAHAAAGRTAPAPAPRPEGDGGSPALSTMTFNLRYASDTPPHSWPERRPVTRALLRREPPHLIGTQEGLYAQLRDIAHDLGRSRYDWIGTGRAGGSRDEFMAVFYDVRRLLPLEYDHFWLSDQPRLIGSATWGNTVIRMVTWVRFQDLATGREFVHLNTHLDHRSQYSRERSAALIVRRLAEFDASLPRLVTGDFNVPAHGNPVHETLLADGKLADTWDSAERRGKLYGTFHGYKPLVPDGDRIDWILASPGVRVRRASVNTYARHGQYPSDHLPVQALVEL